MDVEAIVVDFNAGSRLVSLLHSLRDEPIRRIVVVDNSTTGATKQALRSEVLRPEVIEASSNGGFGSGVNLGMRATTAQYVIVSNPDIVVFPGTVAALRQTMEGDPELGIVGPALLDQYGTLHQSARRFPSIRRSALQAFAGLIAPSGRSANRYRAGNWDRTVNSDYVDWVSGAFFMLRREAFETVGGFDEDYFMYVEEVDLCWRLAAAGYKTGYVPDARVTHIGGVSGEPRPYAMLLSHHRSLWHFACKTSSGRERLLLPLVAAGLLFRALIAAAQLALRRRRAGQAGRLDGSPGRRIEGVIVTFNPELGRLRAVLAAAAAQVDALVVADNGSNNLKEIEAAVSGQNKISVLPLGSNRGIAAALNAGVARLLSNNPDWILTLDQDTVLQPGAVERVLDEFYDLNLATRETVGVLGMSRRGRRPPATWRRRFVDRKTEIGQLGQFMEKTGLITSGNLVRAKLFPAVSYREDLFIDQVDWRFCADVRRMGLRVLELTVPTMDHPVGKLVGTAAGPKIYEGGNRLYYITRNTLWLVLRGDLPFRVFYDVAGLCRSYLLVNRGPSGLYRLATMLAAGLRDGLLGRLGPRVDGSRRAQAVD